MEKAIIGGLSVLTASVACAVQIASESLTATLDEGDKGSVVKLVMKDGHDLITAGKKSPLFMLLLTDVANYTNTVTVTARQAASFATEPLADGVRLVYGPIGKVVEKVVCTVRAPVGDLKLRWRIAVTPKPGWKLDETHYPQMVLATGMDGDPTREAIVGGSTKGGILRNPASKPNGRAVFFSRQGQLVAQFVSYYNDRRLFYYGTEDATGDAKALAVERCQGGLAFNARHYGWDSSGNEFGFDFVTAALIGSEEKPCDWYDAADLYREWAFKQPWCTKRRADRDDLPQWMRDAPILVRFYRADFEDPTRIREWFHGYWRKQFPDTPLIVAMWGWEQHGTWVTDYFPCVPSDAGFREIVADLRANQAHAFAWPSGYHWIKTYDKNPDGSFQYDARARYDREIAPHACCLRNGNCYESDPFWLKGGALTAICPGDPWTFAWWLDDVCGELTKRGCELIQFDQVCGGNFKECWAGNHPHAPGEGRWKTELFRRQLVEMRETMRREVADAVVCYEEPQEIFNDLVGLQDYRDCNCADEHKGEWASVFNYIYHEFVPCFQSNVYTRDQRHWYAHMAVDGQMPFFGKPCTDNRAADRLATDMTNGGWYPQFMAEWIRLYRGEGRKWLANGRQVRPPRIRCEVERSEIPHQRIKGEKIKVERPCVHHAAYVAADGQKAVFFANGTKVVQNCEYRDDDGSWQKLSIRPEEIVWKNIK